MAILSRRPFRIAASAALAIALIVATLLLPAAADPVPGVDAFPKVAFVARNDVPFDALTVGPVAGALGGITVITSPASLGDAARDALIAFDPDLVVIAGGTAAISAATEAQIAAAGGWDVVRKSGATRDQTAAALATVLTDLGAGRPAISGDGQIDGPVVIGGSTHLHELTVESRVHAQGVAVAGVYVDGITGDASQSYNNAGGAPTASQVATGRYHVAIPGRSFTNSTFIGHATLIGGAGYATVDTAAGGVVHVRTFNSAGALTNRDFMLTVFDAS